MRHICSGCGLDELLYYIPHSISKTWCCSTGICDHKSTNRTYQNKRFCCTLPLAVAIEVLRYYKKHLTQVSPTWEHGKNVTTQIREPHTLSTSLHTLRGKCSNAPSDSTENPKARVESRFQNGTSAPHQISYSLCSCQLGLSLHIKNHSSSNTI